MAWVPQDVPLRELLNYLRDSLNVAPGPEGASTSQHATDMLSRASNSLPDVNNYLCHILLSTTPPPGMDATHFHTVRFSASILLKNNIRNIPGSLNQITVPYLKARILAGLKDPQISIRHLTGNVVTEMLRKGGIMTWSDILGQLLQMVEGKDANGQAMVPMEVQEAAVDALLKVCQDSKKELERDPQRPLDHLIPRFLQFTEHPSPKAQTGALEIINLFLQLRSAFVAPFIDKLIERLFALGSSQAPQLRREVCRALVHIVDINPSKLIPIMESVVNYLVTQQQDPDPDLALDAAEFWLTVGEHTELRGYLGPYLHHIVPILLRSMIYSEEDIERLGGEGEDADEEDRIEDVRPAFAKSKKRLPNGTSVEVGDSEVPKGNGTQEDELSEGEIDDLESDYDFGMDDPEDRWNLRKCSAAALDVLATVFHQQVLDIIIPYLNENLRHPEWPHREASVLALGAVADGCLQGVAPHLPELIPYLISLLSDTEPLVRQITCWTLGRYSSWAAQGPDPTRKQKYFEPMLEGMLLRMLDGNKRVQEAAASAFANLEEQSKDVLTPYIEPIVRQFVQAMQKYKDRNMFILYDCIQTLAEHVGEALSQENVVKILMPALIERWRFVKDDSRELFPLLECLSYVASALGMAFKPFSQPIFERCIRIIHRNLEEQLAYNQNPHLDPPDKDFLVTSLDLLSAIIQALNGDGSQLVASARPSFFQLLSHCIADENNDVRQSAYALLGDCAIYVFPQLQPFLHSIMDLLINQLSVEHLDTADEGNSFSVVNNACWSCGEVALQYGAGMTPYVEKLYGRLLLIIQANKVPDSVTENAAVALGRIGLGSCEELAPHLDTFAYPFLDALAKVVETDEKDSAMRGFCMVVGRNPEAMESCLIPFFKAIARYKYPSPELKELFKRTVSGYRAFINDFEAFISQVPAHDRQVLQETYLSGA